MNLMKLQLKIAVMASRMAFLMSEAFLKQCVVGPGQCMHVPTIVVIGELNHWSTGFSYGSLLFKELSLIYM